jgi:hypothetical protein
LHSYLPHVETFKCREEFLKLDDFLEHKKQCLNRKPIVFFDASESEDFCDNGIDLNCEERAPDFDNCRSYPLVDGGSDGEGDMENFEDDDENNEMVDDFVNELSTHMSINTSGGCGHR